MATLKIYVACLASYNNGRLHGRWIEAGPDVDNMQAKIAAMLRASPVPNAEEWAIHDYDGAWPGFGEYPGLEKVAAYVELVAAAEDNGLSAEVVKCVVDHYGADYLDAAREALSDNYAGQCRTLGEFAESLMEETGGLEGVPDNLARYIDWDAYGRDMQLGGDIFTIEDDGGVHVFWSR